MALLLSQLLTFAIAIACLWGAQSHRGYPDNYGALDLVLTEGQVCDHAN